MILRLQELSVVFIATALVATGGCSVRQPEWLTSPSAAYCSNTLDEPCIKSFAQQAFIDATAKAAKEATQPPAPPAALSTTSSPAIFNKENDGHFADKQSEDKTPDQSVDQSPVTAAGDTPEEKPSAELSKAESSRDEDSVAKMIVHQPEAAQEGEAAAAMLATEPTKEKPSKDHVDGVLNSDPLPTTTPTGENQVTGASSEPLQNASLPFLAFGASAIGADLQPAEGYTPTEKVEQFRVAGEMIRDAQGSVTNDLIRRIGEIPDAEVRANTLAGLLTLNSSTMTDHQINGVLNTLYELNRDQYVNSLIVKLPGYLRVGDFERAMALRTALLDTQGNTDRPFSMLAYVVSCYTMAGLKEDAWSIVRSSATEGHDLSDDDRKLIAMAIDVASGSYPLMQDFYDYRSDDVRLTAYLTIAVISRQLDNPQVAHRAIADAVKFIQKSAVKVDKQKALGHILSIAPGVI